MAYHVRLPQFEGPLDLLLTLIEKEKLDITRVSLAAVTDQYLGYLRSEQNLSLENLGGFLTVAAELLVMKSRALLPVWEAASDEEAAFEDLETRLKVYQRFRNAARDFGRRLALGRALYSRESYLGTEPVFYPPTSLTAEILREHYEGVLGALPEPEELPEQSLVPVITLEEKLRALEAHIAEALEASFHGLTAQAGSRVEVIISFLAVLELVKQNFIFAEQTTLFTDIRLIKTNAL